MPLDQRPDQFLFASEVSVQAPSDKSIARAMSRTLVSVTPFSTKSRIAASSMRSRVLFERCLDIVSKRSLTKYGNR